MKKYKPLVIGSLLAAIIMTTPVISFAQDNNKNDNQANKVNNSLKSKIFNLFNHRVSADTSKLSPSISGITAPSVLKVGETGTWKIVASDPQNTPLSYSVNWGDNLPTSKSALIFTQESSFTHVYAKKGNYKVSFEVSNQAGLVSKSTTTVRVSEATIAKPVISNLLATSVKSNKATITWATDVKSTSVIWLSKTTPVDTSVKPKTYRHDNNLNHKIELKKLQPNTTYYVVVGSINKAGLTKSTQTSFVTPSIIINNDTPVISSINGDTSIVAGQTENLIIKAHDPKNLALSYMVDWGDVNALAKSSAIEQKFVQTTTFSHVYSTPGTFTITVSAENTDGKKTSSSMKVTVSAVVADVSAPIISGIETRVGVSTSTISWTTNELATSEIHYSLITPVDLGSNTTVAIVDKSLANKHSLSITGLTKSTLYHFILKSADASNNIVTSSELAFITNSEL